MSIFNMVKELVDVPAAAKLSINNMLTVKNGV